MFRFLVIVTRALRRLSNHTGRLANWFTRNESPPRIRDLLPTFSARREVVEFHRYGKRRGPFDQSKNLQAAGGLCAPIDERWTR
jgi:hypothetical protein